MSGLDLKLIRAAVATVVKSYIGPSHPEIDVQAYPGMTDGVTVEVAPGNPYVVYWDPSPTSATTFGPNGGGDVNVDVIVSIPAASGTPESAHMLADEFLSVGTGHDGSLVDALMADKTLGGVVETVRLSVGLVSPVYEDASGRLVRTIVQVPVGIAVKKIGAKA